MSPDSENRFKELVTLTQELFVLAKRGPHLGPIELETRMNELESRYYTIIDSFPPPSVS